MGWPSNSAAVAKSNSKIFCALLTKIVPVKGEGEDNPPMLMATIDRPPEETREQWLARRHRDLGLTSDPVSPPTSVSYTWRPIVSSNSTIMKRISPPGGSHACSPTGQRKRQRRPAKVSCAGARKSPQPPTAASPRKQPGPQPSRVRPSLASGPIPSPAPR